ncbi:MAG TPA: FAD:protein FMN transferase [Candidatus Eisenbacteria bacterium]|nr:FAD:protein FMN transferase [Candidatus Eisenbacteria bacterium]
MPGRFRDLRVLSPDAPAPGFSRRRFLAGLGVIAAGALCGPFLSRVRIGPITSVEVERRGLGTWIRIIARDDDPAMAERAVARAYAAIDLVDRQMSVHRVDSQLSRVNRAAGIEAIAVDDAVLEVVTRARGRAERAGGVYDPTVLPLMRLYGFYGATRERCPGSREIGRTLDAVGWRHVLVDRAAGTLGLARRGAGLDLGSIGKGWAVDQAVAALRAEGITSGLVDVGRNVYGLGTPGGRTEGWPVGAVHPVSGAIDRVFTLRDQAVATSGNTEQHHLVGGVRVGHLLDARRGRPANGPLSATVLARSGTDADGTSTVAFLLGAEAVRAWPEPLAVHVIG